MHRPTVPDLLNVVVGGVIQAPLGAGASIDTIKSLRKRGVLRGIAPFSHDRRDRAGVLLSRCRVTDKLCVSSNENAPPEQR